MIQAIALLVDAYRDLNARKLFWITLILSGLVIVAVAFVGVSGTNITLAGYHLDVSPADPLVLYKWGFSYFVIGIWLTWAAIILAIISTAGLFPDLITSGTIDLYLSKPISRLRLFIVKYLSGLLFVTLQVAVFSFASFILFGVRAHSWKPSLFLAIPIVVCMFSYLFAICVFLGVWTRSTIAAILLTVLVWLGLWGVQWADKQLLTVDVLMKNQIDHNKLYIESTDAELVGLKNSSPKSTHIADLEVTRQNAIDRQTEMERNYGKLHMAHSIAHGIKTVIPKTSETNDLLDRWLFTDSEVNAGVEQRADRQNARRQANGSPMGLDDDTIRESGMQVQGIIRNTPLWYVLGTSLACEVVVLGFAAWIFCRRDY